MYDRETKALQQNGMEFPTAKWHGNKIALIGPTALTNITAIWVTI